MLLEVVVPDGVVPGDALAITYGDADLTVDVPTGYSPGDVLTVTVDEHAVTTSTHTVVDDDDELEVRVPEGVREGESFSCVSPGGVAFDIIVPSNTCSGDLILCRIPADRSSDTSSASSSAIDSEDGGMFRYRRGQSVQVLRSDGSFSKATVISAFDGVFEALYEVQLEKNGLIKQAVPENDMYDANDCSDPNFGRHLTDAMAAMMDAEMLDHSWLVNSDVNSDGDLYLEAYWGYGE